MSFMDFKSKIYGFVNKAGISDKVEFINDVDTGKYIAKCDGVTITGNQSGLSLTVKWGSGHVGMAYA